jgi:hypothetical protein
MPSPAKTDDAQAGCFFHPHKVAETVCAHCGRFICPLCRMDLEGGPLCPTCLENGLKDHRLEHLETSRFLNDRLALFLALGPILFFPIWIITAPAAIIVAIRFWNSPTSILPRTKARYIISILVALAELALWAAWIRELMS